MDSETRSHDRPPARHRHRRGLSVRGLMLLVLAIGGGLGPYVLNVREQRQIVAAICNAWGSVGYDWQRSPSANLPDLNKSGGDRPRALGGRIAWPGWLVDLLGMDAFGRVDKVWFTAGRGGIPEPLLAQIGRLSGLEVLCVHGKPLLDTAGLVHLRGLSALRVLDLEVRARGHSSDLSWLRGKTQLEMLHLGSIPVRDDDLVHLRPLTNLRTVVLRSPDITDAGLVHLSGLTHLECLILHSASIRGEGLAHLSRLGSLETLAILRSQLESLEDLPPLPIRNLCLPFTSIDDRGLARVRRMPSLEVVILDGTKITDAGLKCLIGQPKIESVHLKGTGVTPSGVSGFRGKKPRTFVALGPIQTSPYFSIR